MTLKKVTSLFIVAVALIFHQERDVLVYPTGSFTHYSCFPEYFLGVVGISVLKLN